MSSSLPLVVDLDRTLLATDSLHEQIAAAFFVNPMALLACFLQLFRGRAAFKAAVASRGGLDVNVVPLSEPFVTWLRERHAAGRELHLCTAAHQSIADAFAARLGLFMSATGSGVINLKGQRKAEYLRKLFPGGFVYAGDSRADLAVWRQADGIVLVRTTPAVDRAARALGKPVEANFPAERYGIGDWLRAIRMHHWSKNVLVFLPLLLGHDWVNRHAVLDVAMGFVDLLVLISSTYLVNDLADLESDRAHWSKCHRPIASGRISIVSASVASVIGIVGALVVACWIAWPFAIALASYLVITLGYSFGLKKIPLFDTFIIAGLFTLRLIMGAALAQQPYSEWLLAFSMVFFFSLATAKRHTELLRTVAKGGVSSRGYRADDTIVTAVFGMGAGMSSLIILALYFAEDSFQHGLYKRPGFLWVMPLLVAILIGRIWLVAQRGELNDDPVSFVLRDRAMLGLGLIAAGAFCLAL
jgi:4-hydroxybenzoate polyprenyltransferase/phosphoserine phosphatase